MKRSKETWIISKAKYYWAFCRKTTQGLSAILKNIYLPHEQQRFHDAFDVISLSQSAVFPPCPHIYESYRVFKIIHYLSDKNNPPLHRCDWYCNSCSLLVMWERCFPEICHHLAANKLTKVTLWNSTRIYVARTRLRDAWHGQRSIDAFWGISV